MTLSTLLAPGLYIVATPIGNLGDISARAAAVLCQAAVVAAEDTRVTATLMAHVGSTVPLTPYHDHNAAFVRPRLLERASREAVALVSDAGTPLISDPGYKLVRDAHEAGVMVTTVPGACAAIAALTVAGLPTDQFVFVGFPPPKSGARRSFWQRWAGTDATLVAYETGPRLAESLVDAAAELGGGRSAAMCRELTKRFETVRRGTLTELAEQFAAEPPPRGEIVLVIGPPPPRDAALLDSATEAALKIALESLPVKGAAALVSELTGVARRLLYERALALKEEA